MCVFGTFAMTLCRTPRVGPRGRLSCVASSWRHGGRATPGVRWTTPGAGPSCREAAGSSRGRWVCLGPSLKTDLHRNYGKKNKTKKQTNMKIMEIEWNWDKMCLKFELLRAFRSNMCLKSHLTEVCGGRAPVWCRSGWFWAWEEQAGLR